MMARHEERTPVAAAAASGIDFGNIGVGWDKWKKKTQRMSGITEEQKRKK